MATFGKFAFAANYTPGQADETPLLRLMARICGADPAPADRVPLVRRLFFESYTLAAADLRSRLEKREDDQLRKLAQAERAARYTAQTNRLTGLDLVGEVERSHALVDLVFQLVEENQLKYIRWEQCTKRDQELMGLILFGNQIHKELFVRSVCRRRSRQTPVQTCASNTLCREDLLRWTKRG